MNTIKSIIVVSMVFFLAVLLSSCLPPGAQLIVEKQDTILGSYNASPTFTITFSGINGVVEELHYSLDDETEVSLPTNAEKFSIKERLPSGSYTITVEAVINGGILTTQTDFSVKDISSYSPDDQYYGQNQWGHPAINVPQLWGLIEEGVINDRDEVIIAVVDSGYLSHPDLTANLLPGKGYDFISDTGIANDGDGIDDDPTDADDTDGSSHGTSVAGVIAAATDNGTGVAGSDFENKLKIVPVRALGVGGGTTYDVAQAVLYAAGLPNDSGEILDPPAKIINMSLGGGGTDPYMEEALRKATEAGSIIIAASGNDSNYEGSGWVSVGYPASSEYTIGSGATNIENGVTQYSNIGATLDIFTPGGEFLDGDSEGGILCVHADPSGPTYGYAWYTGTSFATPYASGIAGLLCSIDSSLDNEEMRELFQKSTVSLDPPYFDLFTDVGILNALFVFETYAGGKITDIDLTRVPADSPGDQPPDGLLFPTVAVKRTSDLPEYDPETIIITFPEGVTEAEQLAAIDNLGLERVAGSRNVYHADLQTTSLSTYQTRLEAQTSGIKVYRNYYYYAY